MLKRIVFSPPSSDAFFELTDQIEGSDELYLKSFGVSPKEYYIRGEIARYTYDNDWKLSHLLEGKNESTSKEKYSSQFKQVKTLLNSKALSKMILSVRKVKSIQNLNIDELLLSIKSKFPMALTYALEWNNTIWIGATPELLLKEENNKVKTVALAGTKMDVNTSWTNKEFEEQKIVRDFISQQLDNQNLDYKISPLETIQSGALFHLQNEFAIEMRDESDFSKIINAIHPTPAISGLPQRESIEAIESIENEPRKLYCGTIGFNTRRNHDYYVNLRCIEVFKNEVVAYAGGGLTNDSIEENEWRECQEKANSILQFI